MVDQFYLSWNSSAVLSGNLLGNLCARSYGFQSTFQISDIFAVLSGNILTDLLCNLFGHRNANLIKFKGKIIILWRLVF